MAAHAVSFPHHLDLDITSDSLCFLQDEHNQDLELAVRQGASYNRH